MWSLHERYENFRFIVVRRLHYFFGPWSERLSQISLHVYIHHSVLLVVRTKKKYICFKYLNKSTTCSVRSCTLACVYFHLKMFVSRTFALECSQKYIALSYLEECVVKIMVCTSFQVFQGIRKATLKSQSKSRAVLEIATSLVTIVKVFRACHSTLKLSWQLE